MNRLTFFDTTGILVPVVTVLLTLVSTGGVAAQGGEAPTAEASGTPPPRTALDSLVAAALAHNPSIQAAVHQVEAGRARVGPAGALPDPMLELGIQNLPLGREEADGHAGVDPGPDPMTMRMVGIGQMVPFPGKLALVRREAVQEVAVAEAELEAVRWRVREQVIGAYAEVALMDQSLEILTRSQSVLSTLVRVTEARYGTGSGGQQDVLSARLELTRLAEDAVAVNERRVAAAARLNALLDRPTATPVERLTLPERIARAAAGDAEGIRFTGTALGARAADSPLPPLSELQESAVRLNPTLRAHEAMIGAQAARTELARRAHLPDFELSLQYGQRPGMRDMVSAMISVPLPLQKSRKQDQEAAASDATLAALHAQHQAEANELRAEVARLYSEIERERARLALFLRSILPQGRAALESTTAGFQVGSVDFMTLLESQATLFDYETEYHRALTDFATALAQLESLVGKEILP